MYIVNYKLIKQKRKDKHLTLDNMATLLGLASRTAYYYKEIGRSPFKDFEIATLAPFLGISFNKFFTKEK